jgi:hypothetical protein
VLCELSTGALEAKCTSGCASGEADPTLAGIEGFKAVPGGVVGAQEAREISPSASQMPTIF